jgi:hypothetical protein
MKNIKEQIIAHNNEFDPGDTISFFFSSGGEEQEGELIKVLDCVYGLVKMKFGEFKIPLSTAKIIRKSETPDTLMTVQFCPSGDIQKRTVAWIYRHGGGQQLEEIRSGKKLDACIFPDKLINVEPYWDSYCSDYGVDSCYRELELE